VDRRRFSPTEKTVSIGVLAVGNIRSREINDFSFYRSFYVGGLCLPVGEMVGDRSRDSGDTLGVL
jgi:hypothetical protein